jgi:Ni,Fe-hydrogenase I large subunit
MAKKILSIKDLKEILKLFKLNKKKRRKSRKSKSGYVKPNLRQSNTNASNSFIATNTNNLVNENIDLKNKELENNLMKGNNNEINNNEINNRNDYLSIQNDINSMKTIANNDRFNMNKNIMNGNNNEINNRNDYLSIQKDINSMKSIADNDRSNVNKNIIKGNELISDIYSKANFTNNLSNIQSKNIDSTNVLRPDTFTDNFGFMPKNNAGETMKDRDKPIEEPIKEPIQEPIKEPIKEPIQEPVESKKNETVVKIGKKISINKDSQKKLKK